jgi:hypothetical protein
MDDISRREAVKGLAPAMSSTTPASSSSSRPSGTCPALTRRDANANDLLDLLDLLDFSRPAFLKPPTLAKPLVNTDSSALAGDASGPGTIPPPGSVTGGPVKSTDE